MPAEKPTPITPEGRRAAEKVRTLFYSIAAVNIVFFAIILWLGRERKDPAKPASAEIAVPSKNEPTPVPPHRNKKP